MSAPFVCNIPRSALDPASPAPARPSLYGHGLLGERERDRRGQRAVDVERAQLRVLRDATGPASPSEDIAQHRRRCSPTSRGFNTVADRMQQGFLNMLFLGRAMIHPSGLAAERGLPEERPERASTPRACSSTATARAGSWAAGSTARCARLRARRARGAGHELLDAASAQRGLRRRTRPILYPTYPNEIDRQLWLSQIQLLWDRGEANGYAHHMTDRPAARHPAAQRAHARGVRRPSGVRHDAPRSRRARSAPAPTGPCSIQGARPGRASS